MAGAFKNEEGYVGFEITSRSDGEAKVRMTLPPEFAKLIIFLRDRGFFINKAIPVLIEYGLNSPDDDMLNELESERAGAPEIGNRLCHNPL